MGFLDRFRGRSAVVDREEVVREALVVRVDDIAEMVELTVVGESYRQELLAQIAGPREADGKQHYVGVTLRCEPGNPHDTNAIRVEVMGQHVAFIARVQAAALSAAMQQRCGGVIEAHGMVVGGWDDGATTGYYGIRVWIPPAHLDRIGIDRSAVEQQPRPQEPAPPPRPPMTYPTLPNVKAGERRLSPTERDLKAGRYGTVVTVIDEEHYQPAILSIMPAGWDDRSWPLLVDLAIAERNPHSKHDTPCIEVRVAAAVAGYFTPKMTERHHPQVTSALANSSRVTAIGSASVGEKAGNRFWRLKVTLND